MTNPPPPTGQSAPVVQTRYDLMGRATNMMEADSSSTFTRYTLAGLADKTWGGRTYPVQYAYDPQGRRTNLVTWQNYAGSQGQATTSWGLDAYRGFTRSKTYAGNVSGPAYDYTASGRLVTRTWARGVGTWYTNNIAGDLAGVGYTGSANTANVVYTLDHRGRPQQVSAGPAYVATRVLDDASRLLAEIYTAGPLAGLTVSNVYDPLGRRTTNGLWNGSAWLAQTLFAYDAASRLAGVSNGVYSAAYNYLSNSPLVEQIIFRSNAVTVMTTTNQYDNLGRLTKKDTWAGATLVARAAYGYNAANQRTNVTNADGAFWLFGYDGLGQVTSGRKYWSDGTPVLGEQFDYSFDDIGNRKVPVTGGDQWGMNKRYQNYAANVRNQYTSRTMPGFMDILGAAHSNATVTLWTANSGAPPAQPGDPQGFFRTSRRGEYFRGELAANTSTGAVWLTVTNQAVLQQGTNQDVTTNMTGNVFLPKTPEAYAHDADGNLTNDGRWVLTWDGENRLVSMESRSDAPAGSKRRLTFQYDPQGRRILKAVQTWTNSAWTIVLSNAFAYDGWNLVAELNATNKAVIRSYAWGLDLSGSLQGAGGVGGMLALNDAGSGTHLVAYDGNGNVTALLNATNATISAQYEYGPFGELVRTTGPMASANPFRWSTQYIDAENGCIAYLRRYYNSSAGRWLSRDPVAQMGCDNPYSFVKNNPVSTYDVVGLWNSDVHRGRTTRWAGELGVDSTQSQNIGAADDGVDILYSTFNFDDSNWGWHFNRLRSGDSRLVHRDDEVKKAQAECTRPTDNAYNAAAYLGRALHPLQDWVAHGDFNRKAEEPSLSGYWFWEKPLYWHNAVAVFYTAGLYGPGDPDNPEMDAEGPDPDGRATIGTLKRGWALSNGDVPMWTHFHGGHERINKTENLTKELLRNFQKYVRANGKPCGECWKAFLGGR